MDVVVTFLVGWAVKRGQRAGRRVDQYVDQAPAALVDRVRRIVAAESGGNSLILRLRTEAEQSGTVPLDVRTELELVHVQYQYGTTPFLMIG